MPPARFLMCPPDHFELAYEINPFMHVDVQPDRGQARREWDALRAALETAGASVEIQDPVPGLPDIVFTNNAGFVVGDRVIVSRFRFAERQGEQPHDAAVFERLGFQLVDLPEDVGSFEGAADAVIYGDVLVCGHGPRTAADAIPHLAALADREALAMRLVDARFYHLDMTFLPLDERSAIVSAPAFDPAELERLLELVPDPIVIDEAETLQFCANGSVVDRRVHMHAVPPRIDDELRRRGFEPVATPVHEFTKAGGAVRCMSLSLP